MAKMKRHIYDDAPKAKIRSVVEERSLDQPGRLVMKQTLPPFGRDKLGQNYHGQLPVIVLPVSLIEKVQQWPNDRAIR